LASEVSSKAICRGWWQGSALSLPCPERCVPSHKH
jgi:hypothetical protein